MNSNGIQYDNANSSIIESYIPTQPAWFRAIVKKLAGLFARAHVESSQAWFETKRKRAAQAESHRDIVSSLPLEEKLRLGMYHFMD